MEKEATDFIESTLGKPLSGGFAEALKDGVTLCELGL